MYIHSLELRPRYFSKIFCKIIESKIVNRDALKMHWVCENMHKNTIKTTVKRLLNDAVALKTLYGPLGSRTFVRN